jgi:subtilisin family serine protease
MMKNSAILLFAIFFFVSAEHIAQTALFVKLKNGRTAKSANEFAKVLNKIIIQNGEDIKIKGVNKLKLKENFANIYVLKTQNEEELTTLLSLLRNNPDFEYVQKSGKYKIEEFSPNDELYGSQWGLSNVNVSGAWEKTCGDTNIVIGLIDTGLDFEHPEFQNRYFLNYGEIGFDENGNDKTNNNIDDDGNGFTDDYRGWNFLSASEFPNGNNNPGDDQGHGTLVAGIMGARTNNSIGIAGINCISKIFVAKAFDKDGYGKEEDVVSAMIYLANNGANVINMSFGDYTYSQVMRDIVAYVASRGVILIASAGNSSSPSAHYPSGFEEVISVGASDTDNNLAGFSNYGTTLDLLAPGTEIISTANGGGYATVSGTSVSAPFVTATVSLLLGLRPNLDYEEVRQILRTTARDVYDKGFDIYSGAGILDAGKSVSATFNSVITVNSPEEDEYFSEGEIVLSVTVLSPFFHNFTLSLGTGENPTNWEHLISSEKQVYNDTLFTLNVANLRDTVYTLKLSVQNTDGSVSDVFRHFGIDRTPPEILWFDGYTGYFRGEETFYANSYTNEFTKGELIIDNYSVLLDNSSRNIADNRFLHSGFIPPEFIQPNENYQFDAIYTNKAGLKRRLTDYGISPPNFTSAPINDELNLDEIENFNLKGDVYGARISLNGKIFVAVNEFENITELKFYEISNDTTLATAPTYVLASRRIPAYVGDVNGDSDLEMLSYLYPRLYIDRFNNALNNFEEVKIYDNVFKNVLYAGILFENGNFTVVSSYGASLIFTGFDNEFNIAEQVEVVNSSLSIGGDLGNVIMSQNVAVETINTNTAYIYAIDYEGDILKIKAENIGGRTNCSLAATFSTYEITTKSVLEIDELKDELYVLNFGASEFYPEPTWFFSSFSISGAMTLLNSKAFVTGNDFAQSNTILRKISANSTENYLLILGNEIYVLDDDFVKIYYKSVPEFQKPLKSILAYNSGASNYFTLPSFSETQQLYKYNDSRVPSIISAYSLDTVTVYLKFSNTSAVNVYKIQNGNLTLLDAVNGNEYYDNNAIPGINEYLLSYDNLSFSDTISVYAHMPARVFNFRQVSAEQFRVNFTEKMPRSLPLAPGSHFKLNDAPAQSVAFVNDTTYLITFGKNLLVTSPGVFSVTNLRDFYGSPCPDTAITFEPAFFDSTEHEFYIASYSVGEKSVDVTFNLPYDEETALTTENYTVSPRNEVRAVNSLSENKIRVVFKNAVGALGIDYLLQISNVRSSRATGFLPILNGAGSQIMLKSVRENLADCYAFPNPINTNKTQEITFANLTENYRITVYAPDGEVIKQIEVRNSPGAFIWDLKDRHGRDLPSGVYLYYIEALNSSGEVTETKTDKFAVVR